MLFLAILGGVYFWFLGALLQLAVLFYGKDVLHLNDTRSGLLQVSLAIGIGVGSLAAGYLSGRKIEYGLIPLGALGLTVFGALLSRTGLSFGGVALNLSLLGFCGGLYIVPIQALIQQRPDPKTKGSVIATSAMFSFTGVFLASCAYYALAVWLQLTPPRIFLAGALATLAGTIYISFLLPDSLVRLVLWILTHSLYRVRVEGRENIPEKGGALFVANHLSLVDAQLVQASTDRPIRFLMFKGVYEQPLIKPFARIMRVIPISSQIRPREMIQALRAASEAIRHGEVVCIFAEGQITRIGQIWLAVLYAGYDSVIKLNPEGRVVMVIGRRPEPAEPDHLPGQLGDRHRLGHVQDQHVGRPGNGSGLDHQLRCLGNSHEITSNFRVRYSDWAAHTDLLAEQRYY